jgi:hypothetical protein
LSLFVSMIFFKLAYINNTRNFHCDDSIDVFSVL